MMVNKIYVLAVALAGCAVAASASVFGSRSRRAEAQKKKEDLATWEGEGGKPAAPAARPAQPG